MWPALVANNGNNGATTPPGSSVDYMCRQREKNGGSETRGLIYIVGAVVLLFFFVATILMLVWSHKALDNTKKIIHHLPDEGAIPSPPPIVSPKEPLIDEIATANELVTFSNQEYSNFPDTNGAAEFCSFKRLLTSACSRSVAGSCQIPLDEITAGGGVSRHNRSVIAITQKHYYNINALLTINQPFTACPSRLIGVSLVELVSKKVLANQVA